MEETLDIQEEIKIRLTPLAESYLLTATRWSKFLAILGFIYAGFILIMSFFIGTLFSLAAANSPIGLGGIPGIFLSFVYIIIAAVVFLCAYYMYNFATKTQRGIKTREEYNVEAGMKSLKNYYLITGILAIVGLSVAVLFIFVGIIAGIASSF